jgi:organic hydroperoxide reductase OsmC/OhrA
VASSSSRSAGGWASRGFDQPSVHRARVGWDGGEPGDPRAHTIQLAEQPLAASGAEVLGGDPAKADPEEMFVASLSSCHMLWFLGLARAEKISVTAYEDEAKGEMDGHCFTRVVLRPRATFDGEVDEETIDSLHRRAHERCFIANSVSCPVEVEARR